MNLQEWREEFNSLTGASQLVDVFTVEQSATAKKGPTEAVLTTELGDPVVNWQRVAGPADGDSDAIIVHFRVEFRLFDEESEEEEDGNTFLSGRVVMSGVFLIPPELEVDDSVTDAFVDRTGIVSIYPYVRATVQRLVSDSPFPEVTLPLIRIGAPQPPDFVLNAQDGEVDIEVDANP